jgi:RNA polymerase sigma-70 factor (ECF subfamily)
MEESDLADLVTQWSNILRARQQEGDAATSARGQLLVRYHEAVLRYLRAALHDEHAAGQVYSNFALRVLEGDRFLQYADPERGRFRSYLKTVLRHMVADYYRERQRENRHREELPPEGGPQGEENKEEDQQFLTCWRQELINWAWQSLEQTEKKTGQPYATLLRLQEQQPGVRSAQLAEQLTARLGRPFTAAGVRQLAHRGREHFGERLVHETARSLQVDVGEPDGAQRVEEELIDLGLLFSYCKAALERCQQR